MSKAEVIKSQLDFKMDARCVSRWKGAKDSKTIAELFDYFRTEGWRGEMRIGFPGNGGVSEVLFDEVRRATPVE